MIFHSALSTEKRGGENKTFNKKCELCTQLCVSFSARILLASSYIFTADFTNTGCEIYTKKRNSSQQEASAQQLLLVQIRLETSSRLFAHTEIFSVSHKIETATGIQEICLGDRFRWQTCCL